MATIGQREVLGMGVKVLIGQNEGNGYGWTA